MSAARRRLLRKLLPRGRQWHVTDLCEVGQRHETTRLLMGLRDERYVAIEMDGTSRVTWVLTERGEMEARKEDDEQG